MIQPREPVLIANRGEIAIRIARTAKLLGFPTVAVYSDPDRFSEHVRACDQAVYLGEAAPSASYLNVEKVIAAAKKTGARYIHPGYGFLSERPHFVEACEKAGLVFVGPSAESMRLMGDKITARKTVDSLGVPRVPGSAGAVSSAEEAISFGKQVGFPILLKATAGGGGKGMRRVDSEKEVAAALEGASREALGAFGDGSMYVEKLVLKPHHVEIQVFGDGRGGAIHLGERECSIQRRHQKVWEESPSPILERFPKTREKMCEAAIRIASSVKYAGAGTFEFIVDEEGQFYFLEMNTRLQVEHPVTELVTGVDLVAWQLLLATGELKLPQIPLRKGSAIEVRLYAEDPHHFLPAPGPIGAIALPYGPFTRVDTAFTGPGEVSLNYDPMIAKIVVWAPTRAEAIGRMRVALDETRVEPPKKADGTALGSLKTNLSFLKRLVRLPAVLEGDTPTDLIGAHPELTAEPPSGGLSLSLEGAVATSLYQLIEELEADTVGAGPQSRGADSTAWRQVALREGVRS
ncbi:MAG: Propionyl-CoA carboxylase, alpha subunit [Pseudomonadota bacterium]|jgi:acetyl-CoA carboxylase biotin carboxylase subunit